MKKGNSQVPVPCECSRQTSQPVNRRNFLKAATASVAGFLAACSPFRKAATPTALPTAMPTPVPTPVPTPTTVGDLPGKRVLYILAKDGYAVGCHVYSETLLKGKNVIFSIASWTKEGVPVWGGGTLPPLIPDLLISDVKAADFDAIIFECGTPLVADDPEAIRICQEAVQQGKVLAALCMMPAILANAGVLEGIKATSNSGEAVILQEKGAIYTGTAIEKVGKIITASYDGRAQFGLTIAQALAE